MDGPVALGDATGPLPVEPLPVEALRTGLLLALALLAAFAPIATDLYLPGFPALGEDLGASPSGVQLTLTAFLVGLAVGQLVVGPLSDRYGRKPPLVLSAVACVVAGVVAATAPSLAILVAARIVQGFAGAGGMVIGRAVIADLVTGAAAARAFTLMLTVGGIAPVLAPLVGGLLSAPIGWRGMLWTVTGLCVLMLAVVVLVVPETHPASTRSGTGVPYGAALRVLRGSRAYVANTLVFACSFGVMMSYISASPFVYQRVMGLGPVLYGIAFGVNAAGLITMGAVASRLVVRHPPRRVVAAALTVQLVATSAFLVLVVAGAPPATFAVAIFVAVCSNGGIMGASAALAMGEVRAVAGTGSAVMGFSQFALGAVVSPLVGLAGSASALAPAIVMLCASALANAAYRVSG